MAGITKKQNYWWATWKMGRKSVKRSTGIPVKQAGMTEKKLEQLARAAADGMEQAAKGTRPADKVLDSVRGALELAGVEGHIPTVREYLEAYPRCAGEQSERNRARSFKVFMEFLGADADKRLDKITPARCRDFIRWALKIVSRKTVQQYRTYVSGAFKRAVDVDDILNKNPMAGVNVAQEAMSINPDKGEDKQKRLPFTRDEVIYLMEKLPAPWCDMVAVCVYTGGLRISDVCEMRWDGVLWDRGYIHLVEKKTRKERMQPIIPQLREILERLHAAADGSGYVFPGMAHYFISGAGGYVSTMFTSLLRAHGLTDAAPEKREGRRHNISPKSFHSLRHSVVSLLRCGVAFSPDAIRDTVGHDSEEVERGYFTGNMELRGKVLNSLAASLEPAPAAPALPPYPATA